MWYISVLVFTARSWKKRIQLTISFLRMEPFKLLHLANLASFLCRPTAIEWGHLSVPVKSCSSFHNMYAGKRCNGNPISTKRLKLDGVGPVDNRPSTNKNEGPIQLWPLSLADMDEILRYMWLLFFECSSACCRRHNCFGPPFLFVEGLLSTGLPRLVFTSW